MHPDAKYGKKNKQNKASRKLKSLAFEGIMVAELKLKESADHKLVLIKKNLYCWRRQVVQCAVLCGGTPVKYCLISLPYLCSSTVGPERRSGE